MHSPTEVEWVVFGWPGGFPGSFGQVDGWFLLCVVCGELRCVEQPQGGNDGGLSVCA